MLRVWSGRLLNLVAASLVVALLGVVSAGIVFSAANHPLSWTDEASGYFMVWLAFAGWMIATRRQSHIRIRFFLDRFPHCAHLWTEVAIQLGLALFGAVIAWYSVHLVRTNADIEAMALPVSVAWMYAPLVPAGLLTAVQAVLRCWQLVGKGPSLGGGAA